MSLAGETYRGLPCTHAGAELHAVRAVLELVQPPRVLELDCRAGGFTLFLLDQLAAWQGYVVACDKAEFTGWAEVQRLGRGRVTLKAAPLRAWLVDWVERPGTLLYCRTLSQFTGLAPRLRAGGVLGVHGWGRGRTFDPAQLDAASWARLGYTPLLAEAFESLDRRGLAPPGGTDRFWRKGAGA